MTFGRHWLPIKEIRVSEFDEIEGHDPAAEEAVTGTPAPLPVEVEEPEKPADQPKPATSAKKSTDSKD